MIKNVIEGLENFTKAELEAADEYVRKLRTGDVTSGGKFVGGFDGCVKHMMSEKGLPEENAQKLCAYINRHGPNVPSHKNESGISKVMEQLKDEPKK